MVRRLGSALRSGARPNSIAAVLGVPEQPRRPLTETLASYLETKNMLLLMDNCERLRAACQDLTHRLLRAAATVRILVTSREALGSKAS